VIDLNPLIFCEPYLNEFMFDLPWADYREAVGLNPSRLVRGIKSMLHFSTADGDEKPQRQTIVGAATHALVFEPERFDDRFAIFTGSVKRGKDWDIWQWKNEGKEAIKPGEYDEAHLVADRVWAKKQARDLLERCRPEVSIFVEENGIQCKGRADAIGSGLLLDLKTTTNVEMQSFGRVFASLNYAAKLACYSRWAGKLGNPIKEIFLICAETKGDYDVTITEVPMVIIENAWPRVERILQRIPECIERDHWPGVDEGGVYELHVPNWAMDEEEILDWSE